MQALLHISDLADLDDTETCRSILADQVFGNISRDTSLEYQEVFVLLPELIRILHETISELCSAVASNETEFEGLGYITAQRVLETVLVVLENLINCFLTMRTEGCPLAAHQTDKAVVGDLNGMASRQRLAALLLVAVDLVC